MRAQSVSLESLAALVAALKRAWRAGAPPDAPGALREHPELVPHRSLVVDLAYEEYCLREEAGHAPEADAFSDRFPAHRTCIREVICGHRVLAHHPELLESAPPWPAPGDRFEQLVLGRELGRGAFARVYLARDPEAGDRPVALKLAPAWSGEARVLGPLSHPHVVPVLWAKPAGGFFAVCMPFVGTATLRDAIEAAFPPGAGPPSARRFLDVTVSADPPVSAPPAVLTGREPYPRAAAAVAGLLAGAVAHLHQRGIGHGDLKPSNVLLGPGGHPYLIDFNLSTTPVDGPLRCGGTLPYMAPERLRLLIAGAAEPVTGPADVYSFGVILFEALTRRVPVEPNGTDAAAAADLLRRLTAGRAPAAARGVPGPLAGLIERCLAPCPEARPTIDRVKRELDRYRSRPARRRYAAAALVAAASAVWLAAPVSRPGPEPQPARTAPGPHPGDARAATPGGAFARGVRFLKEGHIAPALKDFDDANRLHPDGPNTAYLAHCHALTGRHPAAAELYRQAIEAHGFAPAWVRNNRAHSLLRAAGSKRDRLREAEAEAEAALALAPALRAARLNRAYARFQLALVAPAPAPPHTAALADIEAVMGEPPHTADLYAKAAAMTVTFGGGRAESAARAVSYLREAVRLGHSPKAFGADPLLRPLTGRRDFQLLLELPPGPPAPAPPNPHLVTPPLD